MKPCGVVWQLADVLAKLEHKESELARLREAKDEASQVADRTAADAADSRIFA
jgi:hypothetical protein